MSSFSCFSLLKLGSLVAHATGDLFLHDVIHLGGRCHLLPPQTHANTRTGA